MAIAVFTQDRIEYKERDYTLRRDGHNVSAFYRDGRLYPVSKLKPTKQVSEIAWNIALPTPLIFGQDVDVYYDQTGVIDGYVKVVNKGVIQTFNLVHFEI